MQSYQGCHLINCDTIEHHYINVACSYEGLQHSTTCVVEYCTYFYLYKTFSGEPKLQQSVLQPVVHQHLGTSNVVNFVTCIESHKHASHQVMSKVNVHGLQDNVIFSQVASRLNKHKAIRHRLTVDVHGQRESICKAESNYKDQCHQ